MLLMQLLPDYLQRCRKNERRWRLYPLIARPWFLLLLFATRETIIQHGDNEQGDKQRGQQKVTRARSLNNSPDAPCIDNGNENHDGGDGGGDNRSETSVVPLMMASFRSDPCSRLRNMLVTTMAIAMVPPNANHSKSSFNVSPLKHHGERGDDGDGDA